MGGDYVERYIEYCFYIVTIGGGVHCKGPGFKFKKLSIPGKIATMENMTLFRLTGRFLSLAAVLLTVSACTTPPEDPEARAEYDAINDPLEPANRAIFEFNRGIDTVLFKPLAKAYLLLPDDARDAVHNAVVNISGPVDFGNALLQGDMERAGNALGRFLINTTIGIGGLFDAATAIGIPSIEEDFGQTLAVWGSSSGPYIVIPIFGPSNPRDIAGRIVDSFMDPLNYVVSDGDEFFDTYSLVRGGIEGIDERSRVIDVLDDIEANSLDFYATIRSLHRQRREDQIRNGGGSSAPGPSFMSDAGDSMGASKASIAQ